MHWKKWISMIVQILDKEKNDKAIYESRYRDSCNSDEIQACVSAEEISEIYSTTY